MHHHRANDGKPVDGRWHAFREQARQSAYSQEEFSDVKQTRFDLDTAGITGEDNPESYNGEDVTVRDQGAPKAGEDIEERPWE